MVMILFLKWLIFLGVAFWLTAAGANAGSCPISSPVLSPISTPISNTQGLVSPTGSTMQNGAPEPVSVSEVLPIFAFSRVVCTNSPVRHYQIFVDGALWVDQILDYGGGVINDPDRYVRYDGEVIYAAARGETKKLSDGNHRWKVRAVDYYDSTIDSVETTFKVDSSAPALSLLRVGDYISREGMTDKLQVTSLSSGSLRPLITGITDGNSSVKIVYLQGLSIKSCETTADTDGRFSCQVTQDLPLSINEVKVLSTKTTGTRKELPTFKLNVTGKLVKKVIAISSGTSGGTVVRSEEAVSLGSISLKRIGKVAFDAAIADWYYTNLRPVFSGTAKVGSALTFSVDGESVLPNIKVDDSGEFLFKVPQSLAVGEHQVQIKTDDGSRVAFKLTLNPNCSAFPPNISGHCNR